MKIEVLAARAREKGVSLHDRLVAHLPRYAPWAARAPWLMNARNEVPGLARVLERPTGFAAGRHLPAWHARAFRDDEVASAGDPQAVLFADTFNRYFEPDNLRAGARVLTAAGITVQTAWPVDGERPLCCGRTFLSAGLVDEAKAEATRLIAALLPHAERGTPIVGLEPSCLLTLRDEIPALLPGGAADLIAEHAVMFEEHVAKAAAGGTLPLRLKSPAGRILLHGHCHQKAFDIMSDVERTLALLPDTEVETITSGCCGMAGAFGYGAETSDISLQMGELDLFPAIRGAGDDTLVVADGTSCRHQIADGTGRQALHVARLLEMALEGG